MIFQTFFKNDWHVPLELCIAIDKLFMTVLHLVGRIRLRNVNVRRRVKQPKHPRIFSQTFERIHSMV